MGTLAVDPLLSLADTAFVARIGVIELAALGVDTAILGFAFFGFNFLAYATTPLVARAVGEGRRDRAADIAGSVLVAALALGVATTLVLLLAAPLLVGAMGAGAELAEPAVGYLRWRALASPAVLLVTAGHGVFRGHLDTRTPLRVAVGVNLINLTLDPLLIFGLGWGLTGAAVATVIAQWVGAGWFLVLISNRGLAARPGSVEALRRGATGLASAGGKLVLRTALLLTSFTVAASAATRIGAAEVAAHQMVAQLFLLWAMIADSLAVAAQGLVARAAGERDPILLGRLARRLTVWGGIMGVVLGTLLLLGGGLATQLVDDPEVSSLVASTVVVAALMQPIAAAVFVGDGIYLGLLAFERMVWSTAAGALVAVVGMLLFGSSLGAIWWWLVAMIAARGLVLLASYRRSASMALRS